MRNATPKGAVSMWLNIDAGSLQESDAQQGRQAAARFLGDDKTWTLEITPSPAAASAGSR
jgi:hypothetical protein